MKENDEKEKSSNRDNVGMWLEEIKTAKKREKDFREDGQEILDIYEGEKTTPYNILYSNTEVLLPALFSQLPRPDLRRRFRDDDPKGKVIAEAAQRMLEYLIDTDVDEHEKFDDVIEDAVLDGLLPGRGNSQVKYDADITEPEDEEGVPVVNSETVFADSTVWNRVYYGYAKKWVKTPWIAFEEYLDRTEAEELFDELPAGIKFTTGEEDDEDDEDKGKRKTILVYQIWDKTDRKVKYITPQYKDDYLKVQDDPLGLSGFFNCPKPIRFVKKSKNLTPTALYKLYENQAKELNRIQIRLNRVIEAIKARGVYDGQMGDEIANILKEDDNSLIPTDKGTALLAQGGLDKSIWMLPIEKMIVVAQQLIQARESCKSVIYEITGISDIVRGQSKASETLGAQKIKESWGTMRLKRLQKETQRYSLDLMKIMLEIAISKFSEQTWKEFTGLPYPTSEEKEQAVQMAQVMQAQQQIPGQPPPPELQQVMETASMPSWEEIIEELRTNKSYKLDIETNSTLDVEATEDKQHVSEFMNAMAQFMNGMLPMVESGALPFEVAKSMMLSIVRRYRFGREVEDELKKMQPPKPGGEEAKQLAKEKQKFEQERTKAGQQLDKEHQNLQVDKLQFEFEKKLAQIEQQNRDKISQIKQSSVGDEQKAVLNSMLQDHKREIQSMLDKQAAKLEKSRAV